MHAPRQEGSTRLFGWRNGDATPTSLNKSAQYLLRPDHPSDPITKSVGRSTRHLLGILAAMVLGLLVLNPPDAMPAAPVTVEVVVAGWVENTPNRPGNARDKAIENALRQAVVRGVFESSGKDAAKMSQVAAKLAPFIKQPTQLIQEYKVIDESGTENAHFVLVQARVDVSRFVTKIKEPTPGKESAGPEKSGRPKTLVLLAQTLPGQQKPLVWWRSKPVHSGPLSQTLAGSLSQANISIIKPESITIKDRSTQWDGKPITVEEASYFGKLAGADVVIWGQVENNQLPLPPGGKPVTINSALNVSLLDLKTGRNLGRVTREVSVSANTSDQAGKEAGSALAKEVANEVTRLLGPTSPAPSVTTPSTPKPSSRVVLKIKGIKRYSELTQLEGAIKKNVPEIKGILQRRVSSGTLTLELNYPGSAQEMAEALSKKDFGVFKLVNPQTAGENLTMDLSSTDTQPASHDATSAPTQGGVRPPSPSMVPPAGLPRGQ
ncbi:MAG: hypothetical protein HQK60_17870 [Deltaproteobacteria bacterium]|nr:hypothetical protein [Deltaproteobacteria bacterium]